MTFKKCIDFFLKKFSDYRFSTNNNWHHSYRRFGTFFKLFERFNYSSAHIIYYFRHIYYSHVFIRILLY